MHLMCVCICQWEGVVNFFQYHKIMDEKYKDYDNGVGNGISENDLLIFMHENFNFK